MFSPFFQIRAWRVAPIALLIGGLLILPVARAFPPQTVSDSGDTSRKIKKRVAPDYPELAKNLKLKGVARVQIVVTTEGNIKEVKELGGNPVLLDALVKAVKQWKYEPATKESIIEIKAEFGT